MTSGPFRGSRHPRIELTDLIGKKGEGAVYRTTVPGTVAKLYTDPNPTRQAKLKVQVAAPPTLAAAEAGRSRIAWPEDVIYDGRGTFVGFLMPEVKGGMELKCVSNERLRRSRAKGFNWAYLHVAAHNVARIVEAVHAAGYVIGDINAGNFLVSSDACVVGIDCDSFQVPRGPGRQPFLCPVYTPEYTPPEAFGLDLTSEPRQEVEDRFGLAVLVFELLFGCHPLMRRAGGGEFDAARQVEQGWTPFAIDEDFRVLPTSPPLGVVGPTLLRLFDATFRSAQSDPGLRPTAAEWAAALRQAAGALTSCSSEEGHWYHPRHGRCPWCDRDRALGRKTFVSFPGSRAALGKYLAGFREVSRGLHLGGVNFHREGEGSDARVAATVRFEAAGLPRAEVRAALYPLAPAGHALAGRGADGANALGQRRVRAALQLPGSDAAQVRKVSLRLPVSELEAAVAPDGSVACQLMLYVVTDDPADFVHASVRQRIPGGLVSGEGAADLRAAMALAEARVTLLAKVVGLDEEGRGKARVLAAVRTWLPRLAPPGPGRAEAAKSLGESFSVARRHAGDVERAAQVLAQELAESRDDRQAVLEELFDVAAASGVIGPGELRILEGVAETLGFEGWLRRRLFGSRGRSEKAGLRAALQLVARFAADAPGWDEATEHSATRMLRKGFGMGETDALEAMAYLRGLEVGTEPVPKLAKRARKRLEDGQVRRALVDCLSRIEKGRGGISRNRKLRLVQVAERLEPAKAKKRAPAAPRPPPAPAKPKPRAAPKPRPQPKPRPKPRTAPKPKSTPKPTRTAAPPRMPLAPHGGVGQVVYESLVHLAAEAACLRRTGTKEMGEFLARVFDDELDLSARSDHRALRGFLAWSLAVRVDPGALATKLYEAGGQRSFVGRRTLALLVRVLLKYCRDPAAGVEFLTEVAAAFELSPALAVVMFRERRVKVKDPREILGTAPTASVSVCRRIWKVELMGCHPDRQQDRTLAPWVHACAARRAAELNRAWAELRRGTP